MNYKKWSTRCIALSLMALLLGGCVTEGGIPLVQEGSPLLESTSDYHIGRSDQLSIKFFYTSELNEEVLVRPDGRISLQLVGEVDVAGFTPQQISKTLRENYSEYLSKPDVVVIVRNTASHRAYIGGEVERPVMVTLDGKTTVADAVMAAGGAKKTAALKSVILVRMGPDGREAHRVDLEDGFRADAPMPVLQPYDLVYLPPSFIAKVGDWVDLYINRIVPKNASFTALYGVGGGAIVP